MSAVWEYAPYEGGTLLVLLALADYCNDEGGECWPNVASIAVKARLGVRQVNNILAQLKQEAVIISRRGGGRGVSSRYRVDVERLKSLSVKSNSVNPVSVKSPTETLQSSSQNPAICDSAIRKNRKEPSIEPSFFEPVDPRHTVIRALILELHLKSFRVACEWNGREGKALNELLAENPTWTEAQIRAMVQNRFQSDGVTSSRPGKWISAIGDYAAGPLDKFNKVKGHGSNGNRNGNRAEQRRDSNLEAREQARARLGLADRCSDVAS